MNAPSKLMVPLVAALALAACNGSSSTMPGTANQLASGSQLSGGRDPRFLDVNGNATQVCPDVPRGYARCFALLERSGIRYAGQNVAGITATNIEDAYDLPSTSKGSGQIVAIVDAYDNPDIASDLQTYRTEFGLGAANFTKYNQTGKQSDYPGPNANWGLEEDLDAQMVSAVCPNCDIYLVEANSNNNSDLAAAEVEAVKLGAHIVSNSWGGSCSGTCGSGANFGAKGVTYVASAGDSGYGTVFPMQLDTVVSVGGTILQPAQNKRGWTEQAWPRTGGGCASSVTKPAWQDDPDCKGRMANDVAAVASNVAEYDSYDYNGWFTIGGTSVAAPLNAAIFALAGNATSQDGGKTFWKARHEKSSHLNHISVGDDGSCSPKYFCTDGTHAFKNGKERDYGGPTGWGTPHGIGAY